MMTDVLERYREGALLVRRDDLAAAVVRGPDRVRWLNGMVSADLTKAQPGHGLFALAVGRTGKILAEVLVVPREDDLVVLMHREVREAIVGHLDRHLIMDDAEVAVLEGVRAVQVVGAHARAELERLRAEGVGEAHTIFETGAGKDGLFLAAAASSFPASIDGDSAEAEAIRVGRGLPRFRVDYDESHYAQEALLEKTHVAFDKGCYLGQEVVCMLELRGHVKRKLALVCLEETLAPGAEVQSSEGVVVGTLAGSAPHPLHAGKRLAFAMVKVAFAEPGQALRVGDASAEVVVPPLRENAS
jgi:tRNA-modifying protein YgfZ